MSDTLYVTPAQVLAAKLAVELSEEAGEEPDEALRAIANAQVVPEEHSAATTKRAETAETPHVLAARPGMGVWVFLGAGVSGTAANLRVDKLLDMLNDLRKRADDGDEDAARYLNDLTAKQDDIEGQRRLADSGDRYTGRRSVSQKLVELAELRSAGALTEAELGVQAQEIVNRLYVEILRQTGDTDEGQSDETEDPLTTNPASLD